MNFIVKALLRDDFFNVNRAEFFYVHFITLQASACFCIALSESQLITVP